jgi:hypothetical protein
MVSCLLSPSAAVAVLMMEAVNTCEISVNFYQTTQLILPGDSRPLVRLIPVLFSFSSGVFFLWPAFFG